MLDQFQPTEQKGSHEDIAELAIGLNDPQQILTIQFDYRAGAGSAYVGKAAAARQHSCFTREHARLKRCYQFLAIASRPHQLELARGYDKKSGCALPRLDQHFPLLRVPYPAVRREARD